MEPVNAQQALEQMYKQQIDVPTPTNEEVGVVEDVVEEVEVITETFDKCMDALREKNEDIRDIKDSLRNLRNYIRINTGSMHILKRSPEVREEKYKEVVENVNDVLNGILG